MKDKIKKIINIVVSIFFLLWIGTYILIINQLIPSFYPNFQKLYIFLLFLIPIWGFIKVIINYKISKKEINLNNKISTAYWTISYSIISTYLLWFFLNTISGGMEGLALIIIVPVVFFFNIISLKTYYNKVKSNNHIFLNIFFFYLSSFLFLSNFVGYGLIWIKSLHKIPPSFSFLFFFLLIGLISFIITKTTYNNRIKNINKNNYLDDVFYYLPIVICILLFMAFFLWLMPKSLYFFLR